MFFWVAASIPSNPGVELTSRISGPRLDCSMSTPQTGSFNARAALMASRNSESESLI